MEAITFFFFFLMELDKRMLEHKENPKSGLDAFDFLDKLASKYEL